METFREWSLRLSEIYGHRNECYFPNLSDRVTHLTLGIRRLRLVIRRKHPTNLLVEGLVRVLTRALVVSHHFTDLPLSEALMSKYGKGCSYCKRPVCACQNESRPDPSVPVLREVPNVVIREIAEQLATTYGEKNKRDGIWWLIDRLSDEVSELMAVQELMKHGGIAVREGRWQFATELADILAWVIAIANFYEVNLADALAQRYAVGCPHCMECPCMCPPRTFNLAHYQ